MIALTIAGSDSGGGAGIQADLKTFSALGVYGASVLTAITAQNTQGVTAVHAIPPEIVWAQLDAVLSDLDVRAIKIGMVADTAVIAVLADALKDVSIPIVLDPVMVATSGDRLIGEGAEAALHEQLVPLATLITPNLPEAAVLLGCEKATGIAQMEAQALQLAASGPAVFLKGGHLSDTQSVDILARGQDAIQLSVPRVATRNTHGTGCTLSSAIAAELAKGAPLERAVARAKDYVTKAIAASEMLSVGHGNGPVHHFHALWSEV
ncbi:MAG: bifunctional hydroxymethylpyrimidine kinase/phosphomethylpyrimidine kinase [Pseudomonadota bacterium]